MSDTNTRPGPGNENILARLKGLRRRLIPVLVGHRRPVLLLVILALFLIEVIEHLIIAQLGETFHWIYDTLVYVFLFPAGTWVMLSLLVKSDKERRQATQENNLRAEFSQKLGSAHTWDELMHRLVEFTHEVSPNAQVTLYAVHPGSQTLKAEVMCSRAGEITLKPAPALSPDTLPLGSLPQLLLQNGTHHHSAPLPSNRYDLPLTRSEQQIGVIKLEYPAGSAPTAEEVRALKGAAPVMSLALEGALLQNLAAEQAAASQSQRQQIAQNLHDSLAQNISYLRLKLDQLTGENTIREIGAVLQELERMRGIADEAYQQVRNTLDELNPIMAEDLMTTLMKQAAAICERANLCLRTQQVGTPYPLPAAARQQILYVTREALHNIEKHARAKNVHLQFLWLENELILKISDDGVGFNPLAVAADGHYGLWIMQQRAQEIGGTLKITPGDGQGTEVTLWAPRLGPAARAACHAGLETDSTGGVNTLPESR